jgi:chromosome segregation ATPase
MTSHVATQVFVAVQCAELKSTASAAAAQPDQRALRSGRTVEALQAKLRPARRDLAAAQREGAALAAKVGAGRGEARLHADERAALLERLREAQDARARSEASLRALSAEVASVLPAEEGGDGGAGLVEERSALAAKAAELDALRERLAASSADDEEERRALGEKIERLQAALAERRDEVASLVAELATARRGLAAAEQRAGEVREELQAAQRSEMALSEDAAALAAEVAQLQEQLSTERAARHTESTLRLTAESERGVARGAAEQGAARAAEMEGRLAEMQSRLVSAEASQADAAERAARLQAALDDKAAAAASAAQAAEQQQRTLTCTAGALLAALAWGQHLAQAEQVRTTCCVRRGHGQCCAHAMWLKARDGHLHQWSRPISFQSLYNEPCASSGFDVPTS